MNPTISNATPSNVNQYLIGRNAIVSSKGKRSGPPQGSIPPARVTLATNVANKQKLQQKRLRNATIATVDNASTSVIHKHHQQQQQQHHHQHQHLQQRSDNNSNVPKQTTTIATRQLRKSESSSYSEDDSDNDSDDDFGSRVAIDSTSSSTSLCDDDINIASSMEASPLKSRAQSSASDESRCSSSKDIHVTLRRRRSLDEPIVNAETDKMDNETKQLRLSELLRSRENSHDDDTTDNDKVNISNNSSTPHSLDDNSESGLNDMDLLTLAIREQITSTSQLSPIADIAKFLGTTSISPLRTPASCLNAYPLCEIATSEESQANDKDRGDFAIDNSKSLQDLFKVSDEGVTNAYFERINHVSSVSADRPSHLEIKSSNGNANETRTLKSSHSKDSETHEKPIHAIFEAAKDNEKSYLSKDEASGSSKSNKSPMQSLDYYKSKPSPSRYEERKDSPKPDTDVNSQKNTDRILKIIEENSKILDRIMSKNAQTVSSGNLVELISEKRTEKSPNDDKQTTSNVSISDLKNRIEVNVVDPNKNVIETTVSEVLTKDNVRAPDVHPKDDTDLKSNEKSETKTYDSSVFKYGDMSDYISKYLESTVDRPKHGSISEDKEADESIQDSTLKSPNIILTEIDDDNLNLPESLINRCGTDTLSMLTSDDIKSTEDLRNLLKESFFEYSKSPSEALPIDSKIENDLETLLKMSAELLRDNEFPPVVSSNTFEYDTTSEANDDFNVVSTENITNEMKSTTLSDLGDLDSNEPFESKRNSSYFDTDATEIDLDSTTGDISATISSIKNTIKSIDSLCQDDDRRSRERTDKTLNDIIKVVEKLEEEKDTRCKDISAEEDAAQSSVIISAIVEHTSRNETDSEHIDESNSRYLASARMSRDRSRIATSPRRRKDDDFNEYESRARRCKSPSASVLASNRYSGDFTQKYSADSGKNTLTDLPSKPSSPYKTAEKLEIRHTTVTATFYDRFLCQKYEQQHKMDRSPSSPVITKAYLNSLKPLPSDTYLSDRHRSSRSNETSPVVPTKATAPKTSYLHMPQLPISSIHRSNSYTRSCDNILSNLNATTETNQTDKYSYQSTLMTTSDIYGSSSVDMDASLKRHSTGAFYQSTSTLPIKPKKPSELGIKLGLYKPL